MWLDDFSLRLILKDALNLYERYMQGRDGDSIVARSYLHYIRWIKQQSFTGAREFWMQALNGSDRTVSLAIERPIATPQDHSRTCEELGMGISHSLTADLNRLAREHSISTEVLLQAAWALILSRYSRDREAVFGVTLSCRPDQLDGARYIAGAMTNTLPVRLRVDADAGLALWLKEIEIVWTELKQYRHTSPLQIEELAQASRDIALDIARITFEDHSPDRFLRRWNGDGDLKIRGVCRFRSRYFPLTLTAAQGPELSLEITYDSSRFEQCDISRMLEHYRNLLRAFISGPDKKLFDLSMLGDEESYQLLISFNDTATEYPRDRRIHQVFEDQVDNRPDAIAVSLEYCELTYFELNAQANRLAYYLQSVGVGPDVVVALCMERSLDMVIALLGILKAGGAYAPIDPAYPLERKKMILEDVQSTVLLTQEGIIDELPTLSTYQITICLDVDRSMMSTQSAENPMTRACSENLAYVMYTSGSTGRPKGISIIHRGVVRLTKQTNYVRFGPEEVILQMAPISFDASTFEIWGSLLNGGKLALASNGEISLEELAKTVNARQVSTMWLTAGLFHQMTDKHLAGLKTVGQLLAGGDVLSVSHVKKAVEHLVGCSVINGYGPTENTTFTCCFQVNDKENIERSVPIGAPVSNTQVFVLGLDLEVAGRGMIGELYAAGDGLARGYMNRPDLTAEKFIPNPHSKEEGERLYRTGDLSRHLDDGTIEFVGREDHQVKLRGYRIELTEIETYIKELSSIQDAVVIVRESAPGDKRLIAYIVGEQSSLLTVDEMRNYLKSRVPDYMVPNYFLLLDSLPLTANGKLDRNALPPPETLAERMDKHFLFPRTSVEAILTSIWQDILKVEKVSIDGDFFDLGGHSLLATQVISRIRAVFHVDLPLRTIFESPTVMDLSSHIESALKSQTHNQAPPIKRVSRDGFLPLSFAQQRLWFLNRLMPDSPYYNVPAAIHLKGKLNLEAYERTITEITRRHETLRTTFSTIDGQPTQVIRPVQPVSLPIIDLTEIPGCERESAARQAADVTANIPFDLAEGPLLRLLMIRLDEDEYIAVWILHHIVCDNWTTGVLAKEVSVLYAAFSAGETSPLPEIELQYADYAFWQRQWLQGEVLESQLAYWKKQLDGAPKLLQLPTDRPRPAVQTFRGAHESFTISLELTQTIKALSRQSEVTLYMILLAAYKTLLFRHTGQTKIVVGTPIANRNRVEVEQLIGFFVNMMVICTELSGDMTFVELLGKVREEVLGAYAYQDLPFEKLVDELHPERDLSYTPIVQTVLVLQNAPTETLNISSLSLRPVEVHSATSMFDLILGIIDTPQGLIGNAVYNTDLFERETISELLDNYVALLRETLADPYCRLIDIPLPSYRRDGFFETGSTLESRYEGERFNF